MLKVPFTTAQFFAVFADYNAAIWPLQILVYVLGFVAVLALSLTGSRSKWIVLSVLVILWAVNGIGYHFVFFAKINPIARVFAGAFVLQSILLAAAAIVPTDLRFQVRRDVRSVIGLMIIMYALLIYALLGYWAGHGLLAGPMFGVTPCPTTIFTIGMLFLARGTWVVRLSIIPLVWSLVGVAAAGQLGVPEDYGMPVAALALCIALVGDRYLGARAHANVVANTPHHAGS